MSIKIEIAASVDSELIEAFQRLTPQLSSSNSGPSKDQLEAIVSSCASTLIIVRFENRIVGSLTLVTFPIPTGIRAWIEDVVVDSDARGKGVGEALNLFAIEEARKRGAVTVDLTSRPSREAANRLYQRLGFKARETNIYRLTL